MELSLHNSRNGELYLVTEEGVKKTKTKSNAIMTVKVIKLVWSKAVEKIFLMI